MKKITLLAAILLAGTALFAQTKWKVDRAHAKVGFTVTHMMLSEVDGSFKKFDATLSASKEDFTDGVFEVTIEAASINTDNESRDNDLRSGSYFDVAKYPTITFKSTSVTKVEEKKYKVTGNLTMHGVTKSITLDMVLNGTGNSPMTHKPVAGFKITGAIDRTDFGIGSVPSGMVSKKIEIRVNGEFDQ
jgi:polyisoprenoid-binding protein YceI